MRCEYTGSRIADDASSQRFTSNVQLSENFPSSPPPPHTHNSNKLTHAFTNLLAFVLVCALVLSSGSSAFADTQYIECSWSGSEVKSDAKSRTSTTTISATQSKFGGTTWYAPTSSIDVKDSIQVTGSPKLILPDGVTLTVSGEITIAAGATFTIYGQSGNTGTLIISSDTGKAFSGGGTLIIHGGKVELKNKLGTPTSMDAQVLTMYGGTVSADGIGSSSGGTVTIYGGTVKTKGAAGHPGIDAANTINIYGGTVNARGGDNAAGIGLTSTATTAKTINIYGGTVSADGGSQAAGIGIAKGSASIDVTISGGTVNAAGGSSNEPGISVSSDAILTIKGGTVVATGIGSMDNEVTFIGYVGTNATTPAITAGSYKGVVTISGDQIFWDGTSSYYGGTLAANHKAAFAGKKQSPASNTAYVITLTSTDVASGDTSAGAHRLTISVDKSAALSGTDVVIYLSGDLAAYQKQDYRVVYTLQSSVNSSDWTYLYNEKFTASKDFKMPSSKISIDVQVEPRVHAISYDLSDGGFKSYRSHPETYTMLSADAATYPEALKIQSPDRSGYIFKGWTLSEDTTGKLWSGDVHIPKSMSIDLHYIASWDLRHYSITYVSVDPSTEWEASNKGSLTYSFDITSATITVPALTDNSGGSYTFLGWSGGMLSNDGKTVLSQDVASDDELFGKYHQYYISEDNPVKEITISNGSWGDRKYTAHWTRKRYIISYDLQGGSYDVGVWYPTSFTTDSQDKDNAYLISPDKKGYKFTGWVESGDEDSEPQMEVELGYATYDLYYIATWAAISYDITYTLGYNNVVVSPDNPKYYTAESEDIHLTRPTKDYYTFTGWTGTSLDQASLDVTIPKGSSGTRSYTATWSVTSYDISYDLQGGTLTESQDSYTHETAAFTLSKPTKDYYTFTGWSGTGISGTSTDVTIPKGSSGGRSYTANWEIVTYTISYDLAGGTLAANNTNKTSYTVTTENFILTNPTKEGYTFAGWTLSGDSAEESTSLTVTTTTGGNRHYIAHWSAVRYAISYTLDGGTNADTNPASYTIDSADFTLAYPTKAAYDFAYWTGTDLDSAGSKDVTIKNGSKGERSYTAHWTPTAYTISYDVTSGDFANGVNPNPTSYDVETANFTLTNPTSTTYTFAGWKLSGDDGAASTAVTITKGTSGDLYYVATWTPTSFEISYDLQGGTNNQGNPTSYTVESATITLKSTDKTGYDFAGWILDGETAAVPNATIPTGTSGDRHYTASWNPTVYEISYDLKGGTNAESNPASYTFESDTITLADPTRVNYDFTGWTGEGTTTPTKDLTLPKGSTGSKKYTANWSTVTYTITYELDGGTLTDADSNKADYTVETESFTLNNPTKTGYTFTGWTLSGDSAGESTSLTVTTTTGGNKHYIAHWSTNRYTITYTLDGGTNAESNPASYTVESDDFKLEYPTRTAYDFAGWTGDGITEASTDLWVITSDAVNKTFTATWTPTVYTISYDLDGGALSEDKANPTKYTVESPDFKLNNPTKEGYGFSGWQLSGDTTVSDALTIKQGTSGDLYYIAQWGTDTYTLSYDLAGGTLATANPTSYSIESADFTLNNPTRGGYTFAGWLLDGESEATTTVTITTGTMGSKHYTAKWTPIVYTITYTSTKKGAVFSDANPASYTADSDDIKLEKPTLTGYTFLGWTSTSFGGKSTDVTIPQGSYGNKSYTAEWELTTYTITYDLNYGNIEFTGEDPGNETEYNYTTGNIKLTNPTWEGYTFLGWVLSGDEETEASMSVIIPKGSTGDRHYMALWSSDGYTITYELDGGVLPDGESNPTSYDVNTATFKLVNPTRKFYTFLGWSGYGIASGETSTDVTIPQGSMGDRTYTANWQAKGFVPDDAYTPQIYGHSLLLDGNIGVVFYVYIPSEDKEGYEVDPKNDYVMQFDVSGDTSLNPNDVHYTYRTTSGDEVAAYGFVCYVNSLQMADTINAHLFYGTDTESCLDDTYSVEKYLDVAVSRNEEGSTMYNLAEAIRAYGHYAQLMLAKANSFDLGTDYTVLNSSTTYDETVISSVKSTVEDYKISRSVDDYTTLGITSQPFSLLLDSGTTINLDFYLKDSSYTLSATGSGIKTTRYSDLNAYRVQIPNIAAHLLNTKYTVTASTTTNGVSQGSIEIGVSALSYVRAVLNASNMPDEYINGVVSLYKYYEAAIAYQESKSGN